MNPMIPDKKPPLLDFILDSCEKDGYVYDATELYRVFLTYDAKQEEAVCRQIIRSAYKELNMVIDDPDTNDKIFIAKLYKTVKNNFWLIGLGVLGFDDKNERVFSKPLNWPPSDAYRSQLDEKVAKLEPVIDRALMAVLNSQSWKTAKSYKPEDN